jgi:carbon-monoxide dehydrogenase medium subunit
MDRGVCSEANIVIGAAVPVARRVEQAELCLAGYAPSRQRIEEAAAFAAQSISPIDDLRGSAAYRSQIVQVELRRTLAKLFDIDME